MNQHVSLEVDEFTPITESSRAWLRKLRFNGCLLIFGEGKPSAAVLSELRGAGYITIIQCAKRGEAADRFAQITDAGALYLDRIMRAN